MIWPIPDTMRRIGVIGSRRRNKPEDFKLLVHELIHGKDAIREGDILVSGGCKDGGDYFGEIISWDYKIPMVIFYPNIQQFESQTLQRWHFTRANYDRNTLIAHHSDILIALVAPDRTGGTEDTIQKFQKFNACNPNAKLIIL